MSLVPKCDEKEIEKHFLMLEKVAKSTDCPTDMYRLFLQSVLKGRAKDLYCTLSTYGLAKERILKAYVLVPYAYHQTCRNLIKQGGQTHAEFAREKDG